jgi:pimeloyl-ACP methyl ester carboxylesterase
MTERTDNGTAYEFRESGDNPVVVFIHGLGLNRHIWKDHLPAFSADYSVLSYDLYGHGESALPPNKPDLKIYSEQLNDLLGFLQIQSCTVVGFSLGGMINRRFALDFPDRVHCLGILNSPHERSPEAQKLVEARAADTAQGGPSANLDATIERWFTQEFRTNQPDVIDQVRQWVLANKPEPYAQCRQVLATGVTELIRPAHPICKPTLVMTAENDTGSTPAMAYAIAAEIEGAETIIVPRLQHMALMESPTEFTTPLLQFMSGIQY